MDTTTSTAAAAAPAADDSVAQHLRTLADEAEALLRATARAGGERVDASRERLRGELAHLRERLAAAEAAAGARLRTAAHRTDEAVHAHPYAAMGVAGAMGLLIGLLIGRR